MLKSAMMMALRLAIVSDHEAKETSTPRNVPPIRPYSTKSELSSRHSSSSVRVTPKTSEVTRQITTAELKRANRPERGWVAVRGQVYDLTTFMQKHPGGRNIILAAVGRDCTGIFETSHTDLSAKILAKYKIGVLVDNELPVFPPRGDFGREVNKRVRQYFVETKQDPKVSPFAYARYAAIAVAFVVCYYLQFFNESVRSSQVLLTLVVTFFGLVLASVNIHLVHDGCHGSITHNPKIWDSMAYCHDFLSGCSSVNWFYQHVLGHHVYTNIDGADPDIQVKDMDFRRIRPWQKHMAIYSKQYIYAPILYCGLMMKTRIQDYSIAYVLKSNGNISFNDLSPTQHFLFWSGKAFFILHRLLVPYFLAHLSLRTILFQLLWADFVQSWSLALTFQANHVVSEVEWPLPNAQGVMEMDWARLQVETAQDYAHGSWIVGLLTGGLNYQIVHHLFPHHSQYHYAAMAPIILDVCKEFNVTYRVKGGYWEALGGHIGLLHFLASGEAAFGHPAREDEHVSVLSVK